MKKKLTQEEVNFFGLNKPLTYLEVQIEPRKDIFKVTVKHKQGGWEGQNNFLELHPVSNGLVLMRVIKPIAVFVSMDSAVEYFEQKYKCPVTVMPF